MKMNVKKYALTGVLLCVSLFSAAAAGKKNKNTAVAVETPAPIANSDTIAVLVPTTQGFAFTEADSYILGFIQSTIEENISNYATKLKVVDRANQERIRAEAKNSNNDLFLNEEDAVEIGKGLQAKIIITPTITKLGENYQLKASINGVEDGRIYGAVTNTFSMYELKETDYAGRYVSYLLLTKEDFAKAYDIKLSADVTKKLTEKPAAPAANGKTNLTASEQARISLAKSYSANTTVEALMYAFEGQEFGTDSNAINARLNSLTSSVNSSNIGDVARGQQEQYDYLRKTLLEAEEYFNQYPPFEIVYSADINPLFDEQDFKTKTLPVTVKVASIASINAKSTINTLKTGINSSANAVKKQFQAWPSTNVENITGDKYKPNKWLTPGNYKVTVQIINDYGKVIGSTTVKLDMLGPGILDSNSPTLEDLAGIRQYKISNINVDDITTNLTIKIANVTVDGSSVSYERIRISTTEEIKRPLEAARMQEIKRQNEQRAKEAAAKKAAAQARKIAYVSVDIPFNDDAVGTAITGGWNGQIIGPVFWGVNAGLGMDYDNADFFGYGFGEIGLNFPFGETCAFYSRFELGYTSPYYPTDGGFTLRGALGLDFLYIFEIEYSLDYSVGGQFADRVTAAMIFPLSWWK